MRLCINCIFYDDESNNIKCIKEQWSVSDPIKSKIFNPLMFECFEYEGVEDVSNFEEDQLISLFSTMSR